MLCFGYHFPFLSPTSDSGTEGVPILQLRGFERSGTPRKSRQDAGERCVGDCSSQDFHLLRVSRLVIVEKASGRWSSHHRSVTTQHLCYFFQFQNESSGVNSSSYSERIHYVLDKSEGYVLPDSHPSSL